MSETSRYRSKLNMFETEKAILFLKQTFEKHLSSLLDLTRISAPLFVSSDSGVQDNLNGTERPISFAVKEMGGKSFEIVHSLAKWKRLALSQLDLKIGKGIYTDMNAIRPDEDSLHTGIHSIYVDQWDWEKVMDQKDRNLTFLKYTVRLIYNAILRTQEEISKEFHLTSFLPEEIHFIHAEDLLTTYPSLSSKERENLICKEKKAVFLIGIGGELANGKPHDGRAPDYDDWITPTDTNKKGLNGDILVWNPCINRSFELSSMGIRVDKEALLNQLAVRNCMDRKELFWHSLLLDNKLPQTIGGGIGQSRLSMLLLQIHIGEIQVSVWPEDVISDCSEKGIKLL